MILRDDLFREQKGERGSINHRLKLKLSSLEVPNVAPHKTYIFHNSIPR
jgi:hypothetical protein